MLSLPVIRGHREFVTRMLGEAVQHPLLEEGNSLDILYKNPCLEAVHVHPELPGDLQHILHHLPH